MLPQPPELPPQAPSCTTHSGRAAQLPSRSGPNATAAARPRCPGQVADAAAPDTQAVRNEKLYTFLANDFSEPRWRSAALKNAFALLSKQQHELAAARAARLKRRLAALFGGHPRRVSREGSEG